jgi:hypothetical protein
MSTETFEINKNAMSKADVAQGKTRLAIVVDAVRRKSGENVCPLYTSIIRA